MHIQFLGAAHEVTGSCTLVETGGRYILIDCGMEQGTDLFENIEWPIAPGRVDAMLLTHAHIDHSGRIPALTAGGYRLQFAQPVDMFAYTGHVECVVLMSKVKE